MGPSRKEIVSAFDQLRTTDSFPWSRLWIADENWVEYMKVLPGMAALTVQCFNKAISGDPMLSPCVLSEQKNDKGIYGHVQRVGAKYYVDDDGTRLKGK